MAFGFWEAVYSYLSRMVGNRTDAANPTGSLHAKLASILNNLVDWSAKLPRFATVRSAVTASTWLTVLDLTASGYLTGLRVFADDADSASVTLDLKITINGTVQLDTGISGGWLGPGGDTKNGEYESSLSMLHRFNTTVKIEVRNSAATTRSVNAQVAYLLD